MNAEQAWQSVLGQLQMEMPRASFDTWLRNTKPVSYQNGTLTIGVHNAYARDWLESRLASTVRRLLVGIMDASVAVNFIVNGNAIEVAVDESSPLPDQQEPSPAPASGAHLARGQWPGSVETIGQDSSVVVYDRPARNSSLNPRYLFETYVVGSGNRLASLRCASRR